ncbi:MAG: bacterioferritin-associated ferredoxin, partial [Ilumatobacteraceae bacterium]
MAMVCLCRGVSERKVERAISHGALTVDEVGAACGAGTSCGTCRHTIHHMHDGREVVQARPAF